MTVDSAGDGVSDQTTIRHDAYAAWRVPDFRLFFIGFVLSTMGMQMQTVAVGWQLYELTGSSLALGFVGLVQIAPMLALTLPAGHFADNHDRKRMTMVMIGVLAAASLGLALVSLSGGRVIYLYVCLFVTGAARAMMGPARSALLPQIIPRRIFGNAVSWNTSGFELASVLGPAIGGAIIAWRRSSAPVYILAAMMLLSVLVLLAFIRPRSRATERRSLSIKSLVAGVDFVWKKKVLLAAISLDLFAVLFGGAIALLPVYAKDILQVGPTGLGWMRAAPSIGAVAMALVTVHYPIKKAGQALIWAVGGFGVATIVFGFSRSFWLSLTMLFLTGALDNISVVVRHTLAQVLTPDEMRGRVSAVNGIFISMSNEIGGFESGSVAHLTNPTFAVVSGGIGTIAVVAIVSLLSPQLRRYGALDGGNRQD